MDLIPFEEASIEHQIVESEVRVSFLSFQILNLKHLNGLCGVSSRLREGNRGVG